MNKQKDNNERYAPEDLGEYNTENLSKFFGYVGQDEDGTTLVRRKPDNTPAVEKAVNIGLAVLVKICWPF